MFISAECWNRWGEAVSLGGTSLVWLQNLRAQSRFFPNLTSNCVARSCQGLSSRHQGFDREETFCAFEKPGGLKRRTLPFPSVTLNATPSAPHTSHWLDVEHLSLPILSEQIHCGRNVWEPWTQQCKLHSLNKSNTGIYIFAVKLQSPLFSDFVLICVDRSRCCVELYTVKPKPNTNTSVCVQR